MIILGITLDTIGTVIIAYMALSVHAQVSKENKIDAYVKKAMHLERILGIVGVILVAAGYVIQVIGFTL